MPHAEVTAIRADVEDDIARAQHIEHQHGDVGLVEAARVVIVEDGFFGEVGCVERKLELHALVPPLYAPHRGRRRPRGSRLIRIDGHQCSAFVGRISSAPRP